MNVCIMLICMLISMLIRAQCTAQHIHRLQGGGGLPDVVMCLCLHHVDFRVCVMLISMLIGAQCTAQHSHRLQGGGGGYLM